jgi:hypothetical protein
VFETNFPPAHRCTLDAASSSTRAMAAMQNAATNNIAPI